MSRRASRNGTGQAARNNGAPTPRPAALIVRPAGPSDLAPLMFFFDTVLREDYFLKRGQLKDILGGKYHEVHIAELDSILVGAAIATEGVRLVNVLVHPAYRGLRVGSALVRRSGACEVRVKTDMSTGDPRGFYKSLGFESAGRGNRKGNIEVMRLRDKTNGSGPRGRKGSNAKLSAPAARRRTAASGAA